ncbi:serine hydrolase domain-containing protein [Cellulomonas phragmiteti]|uniref:Serine hydrolase n=1 Tax=Cellulomonas phragmiteti TaxID=478780 RepID=A0ABQ4DQ98_9CELL|nr:serine hydrolase domain-containing protein [Cellulomonas phragmiteti]GIG41106.1 serine hydrolase [Cellulomonas phragmiteti]
MPSRARLTAGVVAAAALALPLAALPAASAPAASAPVATTATGAAVGSTWTTQDETALSRAVLAAATAAAAGPDASTRSQGGPRPAPGGADRRALDAAVRTLVDDGAVAVTARVQAPGLRWSGAAGVRHLDRRPPAHVTDRFRVASITKPMVATLVMQEVERGTWALGTRVEDVLPGLLPGQPDVTVEHLLSHRSGMPTGTDALLLARMSDPASLEQFIDAIGQDYTDADHVAAALATPWLFAPGAGWSYSNSGYVVLGMLLEEVTGQDLADLLRQRVFRPAGMRHSDLPDEPQDRGPFLVGAAYTGDEGAGWYPLGHFDPDVFGAAGAATSTTADLVAFSGALLTGRLVAPSTVADMTRPRSADLLEYGLGVYRLPDPCAPPEAPAYLYGHDGASYGTVSVALSSPDGSRSLALGVTGRNLSADPQALYDLGDLLVPMLLATC